MKNNQTTDATQDSQAGSQFATFYVNKLLFGVDVQKVQEVIRFQEMTPVPLATRLIEGLINLRGQIITAIDMRRRLDLAERDPGQLPMNVIIKTDGGAVSLLVDEIGDVLRVEENQHECPPDTLPESCKKFVTGVFKLDRRLLLVLDPEKTVDVATIQ